jgi:hypothetical protein
MSNIKLSRKTTEKHSPLEYKRCQNRCPDCGAELFIVYAREKTLVKIGKGNDYNKYYEENFQFFRNYHGINRYSFEKDDATLAEEKYSINRARGHIAKHRHIAMKHIYAGILHCEMCPWYKYVEHRPVDNGGLSIHTINTRAY